MILFIVGIVVDFIVLDNLYDFDIVYNRVIFLLFFLYVFIICLIFLLGVGMGVFRVGKGFFICFLILRFFYFVLLID